MKKIYLLLSLLVICVSSLFAQAPEKFTYQAVVRNASNQLVINAQVGVRVNILQGSASGDAVYSESHVTSSNANGLITVNIGGGSVLHGSFTGIDWSDGPYFLKTDIDPNGGNEYSITSVQQLLSVPYALYANEAANGFSGDYNDLANLPQIPQIPTDISAFYNDAGYVTANDIPAHQVLSISNDTIYLSNGGYAVLPPGFDGDYNSLTNRPNLFSGSYNDLTDTPAIPTVPTNVSAFANDAGYLTSFTETDPEFNAWDKNYNDLTNKPVLFSGDYNDLTNKPAIPAVPTNVSAFTNDVGYITTANVQEAANIPTNVSAFNNDAGYITSEDIPEIPTVPTNVSAFTNDAGYLTSYTETDPEFNAWDKNYNDLTNKPTLFSGNYNDLTNKPTLFDGNYRYNDY